MTIGEEIDVPAPMPEPVRAITYEQFGVEWVRRVLGKDRVVRMINEILGETIQLGPIGAGPGRQFATVSVLGTFRECKGEEIHGDVLTYKVFLPISVVFDVDMKVDRHRFNADVVVPLVLRVHAEHPLRIRIDIAVPQPEDVALNLQADTRRAAVLQKIAGMESELRRFLVKVVQVELAKPYVQRATHLDIAELVDNAWGELTRPILPQGPEDRQA
ncbi:hypothetical protein [Nocardioides panacisoli]|uniref:DUF4403 family protein n=1 Tax=Nocardioides panacisoli TaxID=627624 RepID=A0ABP7IJR9_9ACTN